MAEPNGNITFIKLCGVQGCCPSVEIRHDSNEVVITDDSGNSVTLTKEQWQEVLARANVER
jgi:hypothetical protein